MTLWPGPSPVCSGDLGLIGFDRFIGRIVGVPASIEAIEGAPAAARCCSISSAISSVSSARCGDGCAKPSGVTTSISGLAQWVGSTEAVTGVSPVIATWVVRPACQSEHAPALGMDRVRDALPALDLFVTVDSRRAPVAATGREDCRRLCEDQPPSEAR